MKYSRQNIKASQQGEKSKKSIFLYRLLAITLSTGGSCLFVPMLASAQTAPLTPAGTVINNTATGTYQDPNTGVSINTTSNTVTATVAKVAGVTDVSSGTIDINGGSITTNDGLDYSFLITNVGNDPSAQTAFHIPTAPTIVGGTLGTTGANIPVPNQRTANVFVTAINGVNLTTPVALPASGNTNDTTPDANNPAGFVAAVAAQIPGFTGSIPANGTIKVVVPVKVTAAVAGNPISVTLGNVPPNDNSAATQNQLDTATANNQVYTISTGGLAPVNGTRQASAIDTQILATQITNLSLATVLKTRLSFIQGATPATSTLTYRLDLRVESTPPAAGITPAPLLGTSITLNGAAATKILVSDVVPALTTLDNTFGSATTTINGITWTRVYSTVSTATGPLAVGQNWQTGALPASGVTRVGFITDGPIAPGSTTTTDANRLQLRVTTTGITATGGTIANLAQVFGQTNAGTISATNPLVYDESGDQNPDNYEGGVAPTPITTTNTSPTGVANITTDGTDSNNNNTGTGTGGEDNVYTISAPGQVLNGPQSQPSAIGPDTTNQTDFTNKSATNVPAGVTTGSPYTPAPSTVTFTNTVQNPITNTAQLNNVTLEPISPNLAAEAVNNTLTPTAPQKALFDSSTTAFNSVLPDQTQVTITYGGRTALYTYSTATDNFALTSSTTGGTPDGTATPIVIATLAVGSTQDYTVAVTLPVTTTKVNNGYSVPIVSYVNSNIADGSTFKSSGNGIAATLATLSQDCPFNITIDREYTGYLVLNKVSKLLQGSAATAPSAADQTLDGNPKSPVPGNIIQYQITYTNISSVSSGSGNSILNASNVVITEDGAAAPNNWATSTLNVASSAADTFSGSVITFFNNGSASTTTDTGVTKYLDTITTVAPGASGALTFQRLVK